MRNMIGAVNDSTSRCMNDLCYRLRTELRPVRASLQVFTMIEDRVERGTRALKDFRNAGLWCVREHAGSVIAEP